MPIALPNTIFYHIPKTGGTWVKNALDLFVKGYEKVWGKIPDEQDVWLRQENLTEDIILFLRKNGETFKDEDLRGYPHIRVARPHRKAQAVPSKKSLVLIKEMDKLIFKDFPEYAKN